MEASMKVWTSFILCLLLLSSVAAQTNPSLKQVVDTVVNDVGEPILAHRFLDDHRLMLVSESLVRIMDMTTGRYLETRPLKTPTFCEERLRLISPDARHVLVFGNYGCVGKRNSQKRPPSIWDLETGDLVANLSQTKKPIRTGMWSPNGRTLVTSSDIYNPHFSDGTSIEVTFWDGKTYAPKGSLPDDKINWWYISNDGSKCFYSLGPVKNMLFMVKYLGDNGGPLKVWNIEQGKFEPFTDIIDRRIRSIDVSPDEAYLTYVAQERNTKESERRQVVWKIEKTGQGAYELQHHYEIKAMPKIWEYGAVFSPDGKYLAIDAGKVLQIFETSSGEKKYELADVSRVPSLWLAGNQILIFDYSDAMEAVEIATGKHLYKQPLIFDSVDISDSYSNTTNTYIADRTKLVPHPDGDLLMTYSNQYVKMINPITGALLQTVIAPPMDYTKKKPRLSDKYLVSEASWLPDGRGIIVINYEHNRISLWRF
jgi:hypothetical protein